MPIRVAQIGTGNVGAHALKALITNPAYELTAVWVSSEAKAGKDDVVLLLCRSGKRSAAAAEVAAKAGFRNVFNILEGFEGNKDANGQRNRTGGWRACGLPWSQS